MSRVGKKPVAIPAGVTAKIDGQKVAVKGGKGELTFVVPDDVDGRGRRRRHQRHAARRNQARARHVGHVPRA